jgi:hypothetical protein
MKYMIELQMPGGKWERSWSFPREYGFHEAKALMTFNPGRFKYRVKPVSVPYRRHAAVSQLELRGAIAMLDRAQRYTVRSVNSSPMGMDAFETYKIFTSALLLLTRQMEAE